MALSFGLQIPSFSFPARPGEDLFAVTREIATAAETEGYDTLWMMDHLFQVPLVAPETDPLPECWTLLAALAVATQRIRLGSLVSAVGYRPPALLAKQTATLDAISGGRLVVGLGAGWAEAEYRAYGFPFPPARERLEQLEEAIEILIAMWTRERATFHGKHFAIEGAICAPKPMQRPHPPILVGGSGAKVSLRLAARYAQLHNIAFGDVDECSRVLGLLRGHCERLGRDFASIRKTRLTPVLVVADERAARRRIAELCPPGETEAGFRARTLLGTPREVAAQLQAFVDVGVEGFVTSFWDAERIDPLHEFMRDVVPLVKPRRG